MSSVQRTESCVRETIVIGSRSRAIAPRRQANQESTPDAQVFHLPAQPTPVNPATGLLMRQQTFVFCLPIPFVP